MMNNINQTKIIVVKSGIKPDELHNYSPLRFATFKLRTTFHVSDEWRTENLIKFFDNVLGLPDADEYGDTVKYIIKRSNIEIPWDATLKEAGIKEGDIITIAAVPDKCDELEVVETKDLLEYGVARHPPDEILEPFNKINEIIDDKETAGKNGRNRKEIQKENGKILE